jgi:hypothetical protein
MTDDFLFPPQLVPHIRAALPDQPALAGVSDEELAELVTLVFFASLEREEGAHFPIRVVFTGNAEIPPESNAGIVRWRHLAFSQPRPLTVIELRRLSRATVPEWMFVHVGTADRALVLLGLARQSLGAVDYDAFLAIVSPDPGRLEIWSRGRRELEYAHGRLMPAPENVIVAAGPVQRALRATAESAELRADAWPLYLDAIAAVVRSMSAHGQGGILIVLPRAGESVHGHGGFATALSSMLQTALERLAEIESSAGSTPAWRSLAVEQATVSADVERAIGQIGGLTALDGATILDPSLSVRGFGVILRAAEHVDVCESSLAEPAALTPFPIDERGARHRAAAAVAGERPGSVVFVASSDGDLGCMLRDPADAHVLLWRFGGASPAHDAVSAK